MERAAIIRAKALNPLQRSVLRSYKRARKSLGRTSSDSPLVARRQKALAKHEARAIEIGRRQAGGEAISAKQFSQLNRRVEKYQQKAEERVAALERGDLLGRIGSSIRAEIEKGTLTIESAIAWAGVHNDGGIAGNNARIQKRTFLEWTLERIEMFVQIAQEYVQEKLNGSDGHKPA